MQDSNNDSKKGMRSSSGSGSSSTATSTSTNGEELHMNENMNMNMNDINSDPKVPKDASRRSAKKTSVASSSPSLTNTRGGASTNVNVNVASFDDDDDDDDDEDMSVVFNAINSSSSSSSKTAINNKTNNNTNNKKKRKVKQYRYNKRHMNDPIDMVVPVVQDSNDSNDSNDSKNNKNTNDNEEDEDIIMDTHRRRISTRLRNAFGLLFLYLTIIIPVAAIAILRAMEDQQFQRDFDSLAQQIVTAVSEKVVRTVGAIDGLSIMATSQSRNWPFVTLRDYDFMATNALELTETALVIGFHPKVASDQKQEWIDYTIQHAGWIDQALERQGDSVLIDDVRTAATKTDNNASTPFPTALWTLDPITSEGALIPETYNQSMYVHWQAMPLASFLINGDMLLTQNRRNVVKTMEATGQAIFDQVESASTFGPTTSKSVQQYYTDLIRYKTNDPTRSYDSEPVSWLYYPVFDSFQPTNRTIVGAFSALLYWPSFFEAIFPPTKKNGVSCVVQSTCDGKPFTYLLNGNKKATFLGYGDLHDRGYDHMTQTIVVSSIRNSPTFEFTQTTVEINPDHCSYTISVHPTHDLHDAIMTFQPFAVGFGIFIILFMVVVAGATYDIAVRRRIVLIVSKSKVNRAIVDEFFPSQIRRRMMKRKHTTNVVNPTSQRNLLIEDASSDMQYGRPIADLFPFCTVIFADIWGFNAWSSVHEPQQVFLLLESIFRLMDQIARRRKVFKVETIGDSYMAVTGLPDLQPDHALRMARFARDCMAKVQNHMKVLETTLGPDCSELRLRMGLNSGQVTAGVLQGSKSRFQLFGDTVNTAARIESTCHPDRVQLSQSTADLLAQAGKTRWLIERKDSVSAKGKGMLRTFWLAPLHQKGENGEVPLTGMPNGFMPSVMEDDEDDYEMEDDVSVPGDPDQIDLPLSSTNARVNRLIDWLADLLGTLLKQVIAQRMTVKDGKGKPVNRVVTQDSIYQARKDKFKGSLVFDEVVESFNMTKSAPLSSSVDKIELSREVKRQLRDYVAAICDRYKSNSFHNFEHASHVTMAASKFLKRIVVPDNTNNINPSHAYGITSNALAQFAIAFCALIHDVDHQGIPNGQLSKELPEMGARYNQQSIAEQNSVDIAWNLLLSHQYRDLQACIFANDKDLQRFRGYVANLVIATDIFNPKMKTLRNQRWDKAFEGASEHGQKTDSKAQTDLKATIVMEYIIQAADVSHTMQHWNVYKKWNGRLFEEMYSAYKAGRADKDPSEAWYAGELWFFDNYIIPLAQKLERCRVFGVSSDECLNYALENRKEWAVSGKAIIAECVSKYQEKQASPQQTFACFTEDEINDFSLKQLESVLKYLVGRGHKLKSFEAWDTPGQRSAKRACLDALEIYIRCPASPQMRNKALVCGIYSGLIVCLRTGKLLHHSEFGFEKNMAAAFLKHTENLADDHHIHRIRALAFQGTTFFLQGDWKACIAVISEVDYIYVMAIHQALFFKKYDLDHAMFSIARRPYANLMLGNRTEAIGECNYLIRSVIPNTDPMQVLNRTQMMLPIFAILKNDHSQTNMLRKFFQSHVVDIQAKYQIQTPALTIIRPLIRLLEVLSRPDRVSRDMVDWVLNDENEEVPLLINNICAHFCWAWSTIMMELCLRMAQHLYIKGYADQKLLHTLLRKAYRQSATTHSIVKGSSTDEIILKAAWYTHEPILKELNDFASSIGYSRSSKHEKGLSTTPTWKQMEMTSLGKIWNAR